MMYLFIDFPCVPFVPVALSNFTVHESPVASLIACQLSIAFALAKG